MTGLRRGLCLALFGCLVSACSLPTEGKVLYDQQDRQIGLQVDPTIRRAPSPTENNHPAQLTAEDVRTLLVSLMVSGWSGTLLGVLEQPRPIPVFTEVELSHIAAPIALAFQQAGPTDRIFFSLPRSQTTYSEERTTGALFLRGRYLHVVITDHSAFTKANTAGGDVKDPRDMKGMKLWVAAPATRATVPDAEEPRWAHFETVHLSLNAKEIIALRSRAAEPSFEASHAIQKPVKTSSSTVVNNGATAEPLTNQTDELRQLVRELTRANVDLRDRLDNQHKQMQALQDQIVKLQQEIDSARSKPKNPRKTPAP
jgi:hypothetical protein